MRKHESLLIAVVAVLAMGAAHAAQVEWSSLAIISKVQFHGFSTSLKDGKVLFAGGMTGDLVTLKAASIYDPATHMWSDVSPMQVGREDSTATLLADGRVLVVGGTEKSGDKAHTSAEVYDPSANKWTSTPPLTHGADTGHKSVLLPNGKVLVTGPSPKCMLYDPQVNSWSAAASMSTGRSLHTATLLNDGRVLVAGGYLPTSRREGTDMTELYDYKSDTWTPGPKLSALRGASAALRLSSGKVLILGGSAREQSGLNFSEDTNTCDLFDPVTNTFTAAPAMNDKRSHLGAALLADDNILVSSSGEGAYAEYFLAARKTWVTSRGASVVFGDDSLNLPVLPDGSALAIDGVHSQEFRLPVRDVYLTGSMHVTFQTQTSKIFKYTPTAIGTGPLTFTVSNLPAGFTFENGTITGTAAGMTAHSGTVNINLFVSGPGGSDFQVLEINVFAEDFDYFGVKIISGPSYSPSPAQAGQPVSFTVAAESTDPKVTPQIATVWDFGDGTQLAGNSVTHAFAAEGVYEASVECRKNNYIDTKKLFVIVGNGSAALSNKGKFAYSENSKDVLKILNNDGEKIPLVASSSTASFTADIELGSVKLDSLSGSSACTISIGFYNIVGRLSGADSFKKTKSGLNAAYNIVTYDDRGKLKKLGTTKIVVDSTGVHLKIATKTLDDTPDFAVSTAYELGSNVNVGMPIAIVIGDVRFIATANVTGTNIIVNASSGDELHTIKLQASGTAP